MARYLVEVYAPEGGFAEVREAESRAAAVAGAMRREGTRIRYLRSLFVPEDETCFHTFAAESSEVVAAAAERAGLHHVRIVEAVLASEGRER
jgi:Protein of unknown function (DUF4242)